jgi:hypothetical protein
VRHGYEFGSGYVGGEEGDAEAWVGFVLEVLEEGAHFCTVRVRSFGGEGVEGGEFDFARFGEDVRGCFVNVISDHEGSAG